MLGILEPYFPESSHVSFVGLEGAKDTEIWSFAGESNFVIVTRDSDFSELAVKGHLNLDAETTTAPLPKRHHALLGSDIEQEP
jgi:hypothetical protein